MRPPEPPGRAAELAGSGLRVVVADLSSHAVVHGFLGVDTFSLATDGGDELVNVPYTYKVG